MDRREQRRVLAFETVRIAEEGSYIANHQKVNIQQEVSYSLKHTAFIAQDEVNRLEREFTSVQGVVHVELRNESTLSAILRLYRPNGNSIGVLSFASAKSPGGGFLNGAMAQEESLAVSSSLYRGLRECPAYYDINRGCGTFRYTDCAIWSPDVVFFRDDTGELSNPVKASVLTLPAVNYGQVLLKGENSETAKISMKRRMKIALAIFADKGCETIILGAYGCGVFRNDPNDVAAWWDELLAEYGGHFKRVLFAVFDRSKTRDVLSAFEQKWGTAL